MNVTHLNFLINIGDNDQGYVGNNSLIWGQSVVRKNIEINPNLNRKFNRYQLFEYCQNPEQNNINILISILSWGGMRRDHARLLFNNLNPLLNLVDKLRNNSFIDRASAFKSIQLVRKDGLLPGLGIGFFTKLICFLSPSLNGYIMDKWVSKSINLLCDQKIVRISNGNWVNDFNDDNNYENFCLKIDELAQLLNCSGFEAEKRIFSVGRGKGIWRNYLITNY